MMQHGRANPLYSPLGCGTTVLMVLALGAILYLRGGGPFSPGPLTESAPRKEALSGFASHAAFEEDCSQCHAAWRGITAERCQDCHTSVAEQREMDTGLHGRLPAVGRCQSCHTDHQGREANITLLDVTAFDHDQLTGFSLARHGVNYDEQPMSCEACHLERRFVSATADCDGCHAAADPLFMADHRAFFGEACVACHDGQDSMIGFDHQEPFRLDGAHIVVTCETCHVRPVQEGTPDQCVGCHEEPAVHAGQFGIDCARCHTTTAWAPAQLTQHTFPLDHGGEGQIACQTCHTQTYAEHTCYNCHEHDPAETRADHAEDDILDIEDCVACHPTGLKEEAEVEEVDD